jgi:hypothetical protein
VMKQHMVVGGGLWSLMVVVTAVLHKNRCIFVLGSIISCGALRWCFVSSCHNMLLMDHGSYGRDPMCMHNN